MSWLILSILLCSGCGRQQEQAPDGNSGESQADAALKSFEGCTDAEFHGLTGRLIRLGEEQRPPHGARIALDGYLTGLREELRDVSTACLLQVAAHGPSPARYYAGAVVAHAHPELARDAILAALEKGAPRVDPAVGGWMLFWCAATQADAVVMAGRLLGSSHPAARMAGHMLMTLSTQRMRKPDPWTFSLGMEVSIPVDLWKDLLEDPRAGSKELFLFAWKEVLPLTLAERGRMRGDLLLLTVLIMEVASREDLLSMKSAEDVDHVLGGHRGPTWDEIKLLNHIGMMMP